MKGNRAFYRNSDFYIGCAMLVVFFVTLQQILGIRIAESRIFPAIAATIMGLSGLFLLISAFIGKGGKEVLETLPTGRQIAITVSLLVAYPLFSILGFYVTLLLLILSVAIETVFPMTKSKWIFVSVYSVMVTVVCYIVFCSILGLSTPYGILI